MKYLSLFLLFLVSFIAFPQANVDSLTQIVLARKNFNMTPVANVDRENLIRLLSKTKNPTSRIKLIYDVILYNGELSPKEALHYHNEILDITRKNKDKIGESVIMAELGYTVSQNGDYAGGLKMIFNALKIAEKTGNNQAIGIAYNNLGVCYADPDLKRKYFHKAINYSKAGSDDLFVAYDLSNLSYTFEKTKMLDSAMYYRIKSYELSVNKNIEPGLVINLIDLADFETDPTRMIRYYRAALKLPYAQKDRYIGISILMKIAQYHNKHKAIDSSFFYANKAYKISQNLFFTRKMYPAKLLADLYNNRIVDSTLKYLKIFYSVRDSIYNTDKLSQAQSFAFVDNERLRVIKQEQADYNAQVKMYVLSFVFVIFLLAALMLWRNNRKKQKAYELLQLQKEQTDAALNQLKTTQNQLIQSEKMASLGELTAGIAHEIQNPLNFVNNFADVSIELLEEMEEEMAKGDTAEAQAIAEDIKQNLEKINHHGKRADSIVKGMLQHSRASSGQKEPTDINELADEYLRLAYHGLRAKDKSFNADLETHLDPALPKVNIIPQEIGRVLLNLFTNAFYATHQKQKTGSKDYKPTVTVITAFKENNIQIIVKDNGTGIPDAIKDKIMQPFFTTKPTGEGTGLGLSLSYDIVIKGHGGELKIETQEGEGTSFILMLPFEKVINTNTVTV